MRTLIVLDLVTRFHIEEGDFAGFVTSDDDAGDVCESTNCGF